MAGMESVGIGMQVVDVDGHAVGTVKDYKMGDPEAITADGQEMRAAGLAEQIGSFLSAKQLPRHEAERLLRLGYIEVEHKGLFAGDVFVSAEEIESVEQDTVRLSVPADDLNR